MRAPTPFARTRGPHAALLTLLVLGVMGCSSGDAPGSPEPAADAGDATAVADADAAPAPDASDTVDVTPPPLEQRLVAWCPADALAVERRIDEVLPTLTLEQKASLMHGTALLPAGGSWNTTALPELGIDGFRMLDGPRGLSEHADVPGTAFPVPMARGATWSPALERRVGEAVGAELRATGANVLLAPTVNVLRHPRWGRAQETYGEDSHHIGELGAAFVEGAQQHVMAVVKHYAANSIENTRLDVDVRLDEATLRELYLPHFRRIVTDAQVAGVMTAYNRVNGDWASESTHLVRDILREEWGFVGFTVSDFFWGTHDTVRALEAGLDVEMQVAQVYGDDLVDAVERGDAPEALVDAAVRRILRAQWCYAEPPGDAPLEPPASDAHLELARDVATRAMVLLENRNGALPIDRARAPRVAVVGSLADSANTGDRGSSHVLSERVVTMREGLERAAGDAIVVAPPSPLDASSFADADVVVAVVGYTEADEGEGQIAAGDRRSLALPDDDVALLEQLAGWHDRVVAVVVGGSAIVTDGWGDDVEAIVMAWYAGARGGDALAALLFGDANFSGRLPVSFPASDADLPAFDNTSLEVSYDGLYGYAHLERAGHTPRYPFGFGRSYTTFEHTAPELGGSTDAAVVSATVRNMGDVAGVETVQVYARRPGALAPIALIGFAQVELAPRASARVDIEVPDPRRAFGIWTADGWALPDGPIQLEVGPHVGQLALAGSWP